MDMLLLLKMFINVQNLAYLYMFVVHSVQNENGGAEVFVGCWGIRWGFTGGQTKVRI